jgi:hypothetical protein
MKAQLLLKRSEARSCCSGDAARQPLIQLRRPGRPGSRPDRRVGGTLGAAWTGAMRCRFGM